MTVTMIAPRTKRWWKSKTLWGCAAAVAGEVGPDLMTNAGLFGAHHALVFAIGHVVALAGSAYAVAGRFMATTQLVA